MLCSPARTDADRRSGDEALRAENQYRRPSAHDDTKIPRCSGIVAVSPFGISLLAIPNDDNDKHYGSSTSGQDKHEAVRRSAVSPVACRGWLCSSTQAVCTHSMGRLSVTPRLRFSRLRGQSAVDQWTRVPAAVVQSRRRLCFPTPARRGGTWWHLDVCTRKAPDQSASVGLHQRAAHAPGLCHGPWQWSVCA